MDETFSTASFDDEDLVFVDNEPETGFDLRDDLELILSDSLFHDRSVTCADGVTVGVCRALLGARCGVLRNMLYGDPVSNVIVLNSVRSPEFNIVLQYIHTETVASECAPLEPSAAVETYKAAIFFRLPKLMQTIVEEATWDVADLGKVRLLLNQTLTTIPRREAHTALYDQLLEPFCTRPLAIGDLNGMSEAALELLLTRTNMTKFDTDEHSLLLCVVDWAWTRGKAVPSETLRHSRLAYLAKADGSSQTIESDTQIIFNDATAHTSLLKMMQYLNLVLICPHRLRLLTQSIKALTETSPQYLAFCHHACAHTRCPPDHPSRKRGSPRWEPTRPNDNLQVSKDGLVVSCPSSTVNESQWRTAWVWTPYASVHTWSVVIESMGMYEGKPAYAVGFVGEEHQDFDQHTGWTLSGWFLASNGQDSCMVQPGGIVLGMPLQVGDVVTFKVDAAKQASVAVNGQVWFIWKNVEDLVYPAVSLTQNSSYRFKLE